MRCSERRPSRFASSRLVAAIAELGSLGCHCTMARTDSWQPAVIAFRVKSGWATAVLLAGPIDASVVLDAGIVHLSDPKVPDSKQPYHDGMYVARKEGPQLKRLLASVAAYSQRSLATLLSKYVAAGYRLSEAGLVVGSDSDPGVIMNPHIRVHAAEGRLFRTVIEQALTHSGIPSSTFVERTLLAHAARVVRRSPGQLREVVARLRPAAAERWRAEEKVATIAAWLLLASPAHRKSVA